MMLAQFAFETALAYGAGWVATTPTHHSVVLADFAAEAHTHTHTHTHTHIHTHHTHARTQVGEWVGGWIGGWVGRWVGGRVQWGPCVYPQPACAPVSE